ncbi:MAG: hypothetical protein ACI8RD_006275 [Bacillariaceae sp.]|jgi:hypothetical protein
MNTQCQKQLTVKHTETLTFSLEITSQVYDTPQNQNKMTISRRRHVQRHNSIKPRRPFVRSLFSVISFLTIFIIVSFVTIVRIENNIVFAADADIDACEKATISLMESNESLMESKKTYSDSMESSMTNEETETSSTSSGGSDWSFGFSNDNVETYRTACLNDNDNDNDNGNNDNTIWTEMQSSSTGEGEEYFICDLPQMKVSGKSVELYGIGECFANTTECRAITPIVLAERLWKKVGLDCHTTSSNDNDSSDSSDSSNISTSNDSSASASSTSTTRSEEDGTDEDGSVPTTSNTTFTTVEDEGKEADEDIETEGNGDDEKENDNEDEGGTDITENNDGDNQSENDNENNSSEEPSNNEDEGDGEEEYAFMTVEDTTCLNTTSTFVQSLPGLISASETYESTQIMNMDEDTGSSSLGYPKDATYAMKSACEIKKGYWSFIENKNFTCVIMGMETMSLNVYNYGSCLANIDECKFMDISHILESVWAEMNLACWEDDEEDDNNDEGDNNNDSDSDNNNDSDSDNNNDSDSDNDGDSDSDNDSDNNNDGGNNSDANDNDGDDNDGDNSSTEGEDKDNNNNNDNGDNKWDDLGLSESDEKCMDDTRTMNDEYPDVEKAIKEFGKTMNVDMDDVKDMKLGFEDEDVNKLKSVCSYADGYFTLVREDEFDCDMMSLKADLKVSNIANCIADTEECKNMNPLLLLEKVFKSMGIKCTETKTQSEGDENNESQDDNQNDNSNTTKSDEEDGPDDNDDDKALVEALGLTESEVTCMHNSSGFIDSSDVLSNATMNYQKSVIMTDPTKLGYPKSSFLEMENVCKDENGIWSSIKSEDVTCVINGRERCLNVYNFGNCLSVNDDCRNMDPMVLVKGFFLEVLKFPCRAKCDKHKDSGHSSSSSPQHNTPGVSSSSKDSTSSDDNGSSSYITATVVLCVVIALGFFGYYRIRRSSGRERIPRRAYEMTDISDLRFESLT